MGWPDPISTLPAAVDKLTLEQVNTAIQAHIHPDSMRYVVITGEPDELVELLGDDVTTPLLYAGSPAPEAGSEQAEEDALWAATPLGWGDIRVIKSDDLFR